MAQKFGPDCACRLKRKRPGWRAIWHLAEVVITLAGEKHRRWRAVDQKGWVLDAIVQTQRDTKADDDRQAGLLCCRPVPAHAGA